MEVPRVEVESELSLLIYTTATATQEPSSIYNLYHSSQQRQILNPLSEARGQTCILMDTSRVSDLLSHNRELHVPCSLMAPQLEKYQHQLRL